MNAIFHSRQRIEELIIAGNNYERHWLDTPGADVFSPLSKSIIRGIKRDQKLFAILLMITRLRFAELHLVNWQEWFAGNDQKVYQPKVKAPRWLPGMEHDFEAFEKLRSPAEFVDMLRYKSLGRAIKRALPREVKEVLPDARKHTHVFRHLETSFHFALGADRRSLSRRLGHGNLKTLEEYIHDFRYPVLIPIRP